MIPTSVVESLLSLQNKQNKKNYSLFLFRPIPAKLLGLFLKAAHCQLSCIKNKKNKKKNLKACI